MTCISDFITILVEKSKTVWFLWVRSVFWGANSVFYKIFKKFFRFLSMKPKHIQIICVHANLITWPKKCAVLPTPWKRPFFTQKWVQMGQKNFFFIIFLFVFLHRYLVFHKMFIWHLFRKLKTKKLIKCVIFGKKGHFGTKKGVNDPKNNFFQKFFFSYV